MPKQKVRPLVPAAFADRPPQALWARKACALSTFWFRSAQWHGERTCQRRGLGSLKCFRGFPESGLQSVLLIPR